MTDREYMLIALDEAEKALREGEIPIGAVLACRDTILAAAHNRREKDADPTAHAEILALRKGAERLSRWRLTDCTLYVTIEPCAMCAGALMNARVGRLVYGAADEQAGGIRSRFRIADETVMNHHISVTSGILKEECRELLGRCFAERRKKES